MNVGSTKLVYFSPTGTTKQIIQGIAKGIGDRRIKHIDLTPPAAKNREYADFHEELAIIGVPVYAGRVPIDAVSRLQRLRAHNTLAVVVVVYGNRAYEDALLELRDLVSESGFNPVAGAAFIGEHSYNTKEMPIASGRPDMEDLKKAEEFGKKIQEKIGEIGRARDIQRLHVPGNYPHRERHKSLELLSPVTKEDQCIKCRKCVEVCPTAAITIDTLIITEQNACLHCCACVKNCPTNARVMENKQIRDVAKRLSMNCSERKEPEIYI